MSHVTYGKDKDSHTTHGIEFRNGTVWRGRYRKKPMDWIKNILGFVFFVGPWIAWFAWAIYDDPKLIVGIIAVILLLGWLALSIEWVAKKLNGD